MQLIEILAIDTFFSGFVAIQSGPVRDSKKKHLLLTSYSLF